MMNKIILLLLVVILYINICNGLYFHVKEGAERCFLEEVPAQTLVLSEYKSPDTHSGHWSGYEAPPTGIIATVKAPDGTTVLSQTLEAEGRFAFSSIVGGEHHICLRTNTTNWGNREFRFYMDIKIGEHSTDYDEIAKMEHLSAIEVEIRKLNDKVRGVRAEQEYQKQREEEYKDISDSNSSRVMWWSILQSLALIGAVVWQARNMKTFFKTKKIV